MNKKRGKNAQVGMEYLLTVGFLTIVIISTLGIAFYHSNTMQDIIKTRQVSNMAQKIISASESVHYSGEPSKSTISIFVPESIRNITIINNTLVINYTLSSGHNSRAFESNVPISGSLPQTSGTKNLEITAKSDTVNIK